mgnify:CR=1 FL=1
MPSLDQLLNEYAPDIRRLASAVLSAYPQWTVDPGRQLDELQQEGRQRLRDIYDRIDFANKGHGAFIRQSLKWAMRNYMNNYIKDASREIVSKDVYIIYDGPYENDFDIYVFRNDVMSLLIDFINTLSPKDRFILVAKYHDERTNVEISKDFKDENRKKIPGRIKDMIDKLQDFFYNTRGWKVTAEDIETYLEEGNLHPLTLFLKKEA